MNHAFEALKAADPAVYDAIKKEAARQAGQLEMIASENFVSEPILAAAGSVLTNKYAEGYPGSRYYGGCEHVDEIERLAIGRAMALFGAEHANVQPHSGSSANFAVYTAALKPGDTVLAMSLDHGGHLTHGHKVNFSGRLYNFIHYGVDETSHLINYDEVERLAQQHKPKMIVAGGSAYPRTIDFERFAGIAKKSGALLFVDMAHIAGLVATGLHPSPVPYADFVSSTTHKTLRGPRGGLILCKEEHKKKLNSRVFPGAQGGPLMHIIAAKAVCFEEASSPEFAAYQQQVVVNCTALAEGLKAGGFSLSSGGTDNHLLLLDLRDKDITGADAEHLLEQAGIACNKNMMPFDPRSPRVTSGVRLGTAALTTRGMEEEEMRLIASLISQALSGGSIEEAQKKVKEMAARFPLYQQRLAQL